MASKLQTLDILADIQLFINIYGESALRKAMQQYIDNQQTYLCKTKSQTARIKISDIYYLQSRQHNITIHTLHGIYKKYGTLSQELTALYPYGFIKCTQSCIVSLSKIRSIQNNDVTLIDDTVLHRRDSKGRHAGGEGKMPETKICDFHAEGSKRRGGAFLLAAFKGT